MVTESETTLHILISLIEQYAFSSQKVHDLNIAATMMDNGINYLFTYNVRDFEKIQEIHLLKF